MTSLQGLENSYVRQTDYPASSTHWSDSKKRNEFLIFLVVYVLWTAWDLMSDCLFAIESWQYDQTSSLPSLSPFRFFFPVTVSALGLAVLLTTVSNFRVLRRVILLSTDEHQEQGPDGKLVLNDYVSIVPRWFDLSFSFLSYSKLFGFGFQVGDDFLIYSGVVSILMSMFNFFVSTLAIARAAWCVVTLALSTTAGTLRVIDHDDLWPEFVLEKSRAFTDKLAAWCKAAEVVDAGDDDGYLRFASMYIVRPIASLFQFDSIFNNKNIDLDDPPNSGFGHRALTCWSNYMTYENGPYGNQARAFLVIVPLMVIIVFVSTLHILLSVFMAAYYLTSLLLLSILLICTAPFFLIFHNFLPPLLYGAFFAYCNMVKYMTGALCVFSEKLPGLRFQSGPSALALQAIPVSFANIHGVHMSAFVLLPVDSRFFGSHVSQALAALLYFPLRAIFCTFISLLSCIFCIFTWISKAMMMCVVAVVQFFSTVFISCVRITSFSVGFTCISLWMVVSVLSMIGMELLCLCSGMTNPEFGYMLYGDVTPMRYKLGAVAGFCEDVPGLVLQAYFSHIVGTSSFGGRVRIASLVVAGWRVFSLIFIRWHVIRSIGSGGSSQQWEIQQRRMNGSHLITAEILYKFRDSLFPDVFSAILRMSVVAIYAFLFGSLAYYNFSPSGVAQLVNSYYPKPVICYQSDFQFNICSSDSVCNVDGSCSCNPGYFGDGIACTAGYLGTCNNNATCHYTAACSNLAGQGYACSCPSWMVGDGYLDSPCTCALQDYPVPDFERGVCVRAGSHASQGQVAGLVVGGICFLFASISITYLGFRCNRKRGLLSLFFVCIAALIIWLPVGLLNNKWAPAPKTACGANSSAYKLCDLNAKCVGGSDCACNSGYAGNGTLCVVGSLGECVLNDPNGCDKLSTCDVVQFIDGGGKPFTVRTCTCPKWLTGAGTMASPCVCPTDSYSRPDPFINDCVNGDYLTSGQVAGLVFGSVFGVIAVLVLFLWSNGSKECFLCIALIMVIIVISVAATWRQWANPVCGDGTTGVFHSYCVFHEEHTYCVGKYSSETSSWCCTTSQANDCKYCNSDECWSAGTVPSSQNMKCILVFAMLSVAIMSL
jgi:hypothetical protein